LELIAPTDPLSHSADLTTENVERLRELFPQAVTEDRGGKRIDFDVLRELLGGELATGEEKYGLNWHGKRAARRLALTPSTGTLRPAPEDSVDWDTTQNLMIEGDNLEVLKLLQKSYAGKVKMIYIDPPYNTKRDFVYKDNYRDPIGEYLRQTRQMNTLGETLSSEAEIGGRWHTRWLNFMYPRLLLARNLLVEDGFIFVSINDLEIENLRSMLDDVFGEENFVAQFVWNSEGHTDNQFDVKVNHEYVVLYARSAALASLGYVVDPNVPASSNLWQGFAENSITKNGPANPPSEVELPIGFPCQSVSLLLPISGITSDFFEVVGERGFISRDDTERFGVTYPVRLDRMIVSDGVLSSPCRIFSGWANVNKLKAYIANECRPLEEDGDLLSFHLSANGVVYYRREREKARNILSVLRNLGTTERMRAELEELGIPFSYPKPKELLRYILKIGNLSNGIVLDFFAGSGTTAEAVTLNNMEAAASGRYILVQLDQPLSLSGSAQEQHAAGFLKSIGKSSNVAELTKERLRRSTVKAKAAYPMFHGDVGFRVFKLDTTSIRPWDPTLPVTEQRLLGEVDNILPGRTEQDLLYERLLKRGLELTVPIVERAIAGKRVYAVTTGDLIACLAPHIESADVETLAEGIVTWHKELAPPPAVDPNAPLEKPAKFDPPLIVFRDTAFADDVAKSNLTEILKQHNLTDVRSL
jgi:adenine-specific DNA-methyltransferase